LHGLSIAQFELFKNYFQIILQKNPNQNFGQKKAPHRAKGGGQKENRAR
jgi:hypothetical protein